MEWKKFDKFNMNDLLDDASYLVAWQGKDLRIQGWHRAFWSSEEERFFCVETGFSLKVDFYFKVPDLPEIINPKDILRESGIYEINGNVFIYSTVNNKDEI